MAIVTSVPAPLLRRDLRKQLRVRARWWWTVIDIAVVAALGVALSMGLKAFALRSFFIPSESMVPTLQVDDRVLVDKLTPSFGGYDRGDIIVFADPGRWLGTDTYEPSLLQTVGLMPDGGGYLIKRLIGGPGDHVVGAEDGSVAVNGVPLVEPYALPATQEPFDVVVGEDEVWVMGDNRGNSADSRYNGPVPLTAVEGRAFWVFFPFSAFGPA